MMFDDGLTPGPCVACSPPSPLARHSSSVTSTPPRPSPTRPCSSTLPRLSRSRPPRDWPRATRPAPAAGRRRPSGASGAAGVRGGRRRGRPARGVSFSRTRSCRRSRRPGRPAPWRPRPASGPRRPRGGPAPSLWRVWRLRRPRGPAPWLPRVGGRAGVPPRAPRRGRCGRAARRCAGRLRLPALRPIRLRVPCPRGVACAFHALAALARVVRARVAIMRSGLVVRASAVVAHGGHGHALGTPSADGGPRPGRAPPWPLPVRARRPRGNAASAAPERARGDRPSLARPAASKFQNSPCPVFPPASFKFQNKLSPVNSFPPPPGSSPRAVPVLPASSATPVAVSVDARPLVPIVTPTPTQFLGPDARRQR